MSHNELFDYVSFIILCKRKRPFNNGDKVIDKQQIDAKVMTIRYTYRHNNEIYARCDWFVTDDNNKGYYYTGYFSCSELALVVKFK